MGTLFVTDLDGTLLNRHAALSTFTTDALNQLLTDGVPFSYATARSWFSAWRITHGLVKSFPVVVNNGAFIRDSQTGEILSSHYFCSEECAEARERFAICGVFPFVYSLFGKVERVSYRADKLCCEMRRYLESRPGDPRMRAVESQADLYAGMPFYFNCIGPKWKLQRVYETFQGDPRFLCIFDVDLYSGDYWCEIMPSGTTKANGVLLLKQMLGCDRVVSFGDSLNDLSMFQISDECYAVGNAKPEVKAVATAVLEDHEQDSVARWLLQHALHRI